MLKYVHCTACNTLVQLQLSRFITWERIQCVKCHERHETQCVYCNAKLYCGVHCCCYECTALYSASIVCHTCGIRCGRGLCVVCSVQSQYAMTLPEFLNTRYPVLADGVVTDLLQAVKSVESHHASASSSGPSAAALVKFWWKRSRFSRSRELHFAQRGRNQEFIR